MNIEDLATLLRRAGVVPPDPRHAAPLDPHVHAWTSGGRDAASFISPSTGGVLVSVRFADGVASPARIDVEPVWPEDEPSVVHQLIADLADASGMPESIRSLRRAIGWGAWGAPAVAPGPFVGIAGGPTPSLRAWSPLLWPQRGAQPWDDVLATPAPPLPGDISPVMAGVHTAGSATRKVSAYVRTAIEATDDVKADHAVSGLVNEAVDRDPDAYRGWAYRLGSDGAWQRIAEIDAARCDPEFVCRWLGTRSGGRSATQLIRLIDAGLHPAIVTTAMNGEPFSAVYLSPTPPRARRPPVAQVALDDSAMDAIRRLAPDEPLQAVVGADGRVRTEFVDLRPVG